MGLVDKLKEALDNSELGKAIKDLKKNPNDTILKKRVLDLRLIQLDIFARDYAKNMDHVKKAEKEMLELLEQGRIFPKTIEHFANVYVRLGQSEEYNGDMKYKMAEIGSALYNIIYGELDRVSKDRVYRDRLAWYVSFCKKYKLDPMIPEDYVSMVQPKAQVQPT